MVVKDPSHSHYGSEREIGFLRQIVNPAGFTALELDEFEFKFRNKSDNNGRCSILYFIGHHSMTYKHGVVSEIPKDQGFPAEDEFLPQSRIAEPGQIFCQLPVLIRRYSQTQMQLMIH